MEKQVAILIDGDNISSKYAEYIKQEAMRIGKIKVCRLYGSVTSPSVRSWYPVMPLHGITPVLQISYANGKSITDQALTIDAMDILYSKGIDVICLVSSDSDFTKLAYRIKEEGIQVIGMGERKTNEALAKACDEFKVLDLIYKSVAEEEEKTRIIEPIETIPEDVLNAEEEKSDVVISIPTESDIIEDIVDILEDDEWENLSNVGINISKRRPGFDVRIYGYRNMSDFIRKHRDTFVMKKVKAEDGIHEIVYIKKRMA
ncbi:MAG: NYN domain-containing protein [Lachnospiraceae bacterium]|nr:NYN domain-containing protein [Lachnospiraceae bacterium]